MNQFVSGLAGSFQAGERVAKFSFMTLVSIGLVELAIGSWTGSVGLTADGVDSISDSVISVIVWIGLHYSRRRPDARFHFGYHKVESLSALVVSIGMVGVAGYIMLHSYFTFLNPRAINYPEVAFITLLCAGTVSLYRAFRMRAVAKKYGLLSLRTDANNSLKDGTASFVVLANVAGASLGFLQLDAVGGMIVSAYIIGIAYVAIKESSLVLLDACESPEMTSVLANALKTVNGVQDVKSIKLRPSGPYLTGIISLVVDGQKTIVESEGIRRQVLDTVSAIVEPLGEITVIFRSESQA
ncbi:MAG: cation diffusion facilitator family transporter [Candidatus Bathyarchaeia archaeon]